MEGERARGEKKEGCIRGSGMKRGCWERWVLREGEREGSDMKAG